MHNLKHIDINTFEPKDYLHSVGQAMRNGKNNKNKDNYLKYENILDSCFDDYTHKFSSRQLESINATPNFSKSEALSIRNLYESGKNVQIFIWNELTRLNNNVKIMCPICGENLAEELDHYIPREVHPEFSLHLLNLIPLCHRCNHLKLAHWLDGNNNREIFNAYLDHPTSNFIYSSSLNIVHGLPTINVSINYNNVKTTEDKLEVSTAKILDSCSFYEEKANQELQKRIIMIQAAYSIELPSYNNDKDVYWKAKCIFFNACLSKPMNFKVSDILTLQSMLDPSFGSWIKTIMV